jgi:methionine-S-sulfoxide reductase
VPQGRTLLVTSTEDSGPGTLRQALQDAQTGDTITFDPAVISYDEILSVFWCIHNPTTRNRQGHDSGTQYRSIIFYHSEEQRSVAEKSLREADASGVWTSPIVTELLPFTTFYQADERHQGYYLSHPEEAYCQVVIEPKVAKLRLGQVKGSPSQVGPSTIWITAIEPGVWITVRSVRAYILCGHALGIFTVAYDLEVGICVSSPERNHNAEDTRQVSGSDCRSGHKRLWNGQVVTVGGLQRLEIKTSLRRFFRDNNMDDIRQLNQYRNSRTPRIIRDE